MRGLWKPFLLSITKVSFGQSCTKRRGLPAPGYEWGAPAETKGVESFSNGNSIHSQLSALITVNSSQLFSSVTLVAKGKLKIFNYVGASL